MKNLICDENNLIVYNLLTDQLYLCKSKKDYDEMINNSSSNLWNYKNSSTLNKSQILSTLKDNLKKEITSKILSPVN